MRLPEPEFLLGVRLSYPNDCRGSLVLEEGGQGVLTHRKGQG